LLRFRLFFFLRPCPFCSFLLRSGTRPSLQLGRWRDRAAQPFTRLPFLRVVGPSEPQPNSPLSVSRFGRVSLPMEPVKVRPRPARFALFFDPDAPLLNTDHTGPRGPSTRFVELFFAVVTRVVSRVGPPPDSHTEVFPWLVFLPFSPPLSQNPGPFSAVDLQF